MKGELEYGIKGISSSVRLKNDCWLFLNPVLEPLCRPIFMHYRNQMDFKFLPIMSFITHPFVSQQWVVKNGILALYENLCRLNCQNLPYKSELSIESGEHHKQSNLTPKSTSSVLERLIHADR